MTDTPLDLDAIEARAVAVAHHRTGPGRCACGYDAYKVGGFFPDYHAMLMNHLDRAPRAVPPANTDDVLALVAALRDAQDRIDTLSMMGMQDFDAAERDQDRIRAEKAEALAAVVLALHEPEDVPSSGHYYCDPDDCKRAGEGILVARCRTCELVHPCPTRVAITDGDGGAS